RQLAELLGAPVGMSENGLGTLDARHPLAFSQIGAHKLWAQADVVLALGSRLYAPVFNWGWDEDLRIFKVDLEAEELGRLPAPLQGIQAEVGQFVAALCEALPRYLKKPLQLLSALQAVRAACARDLAPLALPR